MSVNYLGYLAAALYFIAAAFILLRQLNKTQKEIIEVIPKKK